MTSSTAKGYGQAHRRARLAVLARDGWVCQWCGGPATEADHLGAKVPDPALMVAACRSCNARRGLAKANANRAAARAAGAGMCSPSANRNEPNIAPKPTPPTPTPTPTAPAPAAPSRRW